MNQFEKENYSFDDVVALMVRLRAPDGCEWDKAQTHQSIRANLLEEAYELVQAIDNKDIPNMIEEEGDVLLQVIFHAVMAEESGTFDIQRVLNGLAHKLISRHTHIFGEDKAANAEEALAFWTAAKAKEKSQKSYTDRLESVPKALPQLMYAEKVQKVAKKCGFDWTDDEGCYAKLQEEIEELKNATTEDEREDEAGDLLFAAVNLLRRLGVEPEVALRRATAKFAKRFSYMERVLTAEGGSLNDYSLDQMEEVWQEAKRKA